MGRVRVQKTLALVPSYWYVNPDPGLIAQLLVSRTRTSRFCLSEKFRNPNVGVTLLVEGRKFLIQLGTWSRVSQMLCW